MSTSTKGADGGSNQAQKDILEPTHHLWGKGGLYLVHRNCPVLCCTSVVSVLPNGMTGSAGDLSKHIPIPVRLKFSPFHSIDFLGFAVELKVEFHPTPIMGDYSDNKMQTMVDEMTRFEEEIGMPYIPPEMDKRKATAAAANPQYVIRTNTFNQAQQNLMQGPETTMFVPNQVINRTQGPVNPSYSNNVNPYNQGIPPPPQPPSFAPQLMNMPTVAAPAAPNPALAQHPDPSYFARPTATATVTSPEKKPETNADGTPKVVLSATPKLYTPKVETYDYSTPVPSSLSYEYPKPTEYSNKNSKKRADDYIKKDGKQYALPSISPYDPVAKKKKQKKFVRVSGGQTWEDPTLSEWEDGDFRLFCGDLGNDVTDELLTRMFSRYPSFTKARVVRDKRTNKTKGFGFISFKDPQDFIKASKEMNGRYVGSRPIKLRKSTWKNRNLDSVKKKEKEKAALIALLTGKN